MATSYNPKVVGSNPAPATQKSEPKRYIVDLVSYREGLRIFRKPFFVLKTERYLVLSYSSKYALTDIVVCGECGAKYKRVTWARNGEKKIVWRCANRLKHGRRLCRHSPTIPEESIHNAIIKSLNAMLESRSTLNEMLKGSLAAILGASRGEMRIGSITNEIALLNNQIYDMVKEEIEKRSENEVIEKKCAELHGKIKVLKEEIKSIRTEKQMAEAGSGKLRDVYEALQSMNTEFTEFDDIAVRRLVSRVSILSEDKVIVTLCDSLDIEQQIQIGK